MTSKPQSIIPLSTPVKLSLTEQSKKTYDTTDKNGNIYFIPDSSSNQGSIRKLAPIQMFDPRNEKGAKDRNCNEVIESLFMQKSCADNTDKKDLLHFRERGSKEKIF